MSERIEPVTRLYRLNIGKNSLDLLLLVFVELCSVISIQSWSLEIEYFCLRGGPKKSTAASESQ